MKQFIQLIFTTWLIILGQSMPPQNSSYDQKLLSQLEQDLQKIGDTSEINFKLYILCVFDGNIFRAEQSAKLHAIYQYLIEHPEARLTIEHHVDCRGDFIYNQKLSAARAENIKRFLTKKKIKKHRIITLGFGESRPKNGCNCLEQICNYEQYLENHRTVLRLIN